MTRLSRVLQFLLIEDNKNRSRNPHNYPSVMSQVYTLSPGLKYMFLFDGNSLSSFLQFPSTSVSISVILSIELLQCSSAISGFPHGGLHILSVSSLSASVTPCCLLQCSFVLPTLSVLAFLFSSLFRTLNVRIIKDE